jgi:hypothetical protein
LPTQTGVVPLQSPSVSHATQVPVVVLQTGSGPLHWPVFVPEHCVHRPFSGPLVWHAGVGTAHCESFVHGPHVHVVVLQMGVAPEQLAFVAHCSHWLVTPVLTQTGSSSVQSLFTAHCAHWPSCGPLVTHTGSSPAATH